MQLKLEDLTLEQKLGMVLCARRCNDPEDFKYTLELVRNHAVGSIQVSINNRTDEVIKAIREVADYPVLIINDMEAGYQKSSYPQIPALTLAATGNIEYAKSFAKGIVSSAKKDGFDGIWGPVLDIHQANAPCKISRIYGDTPESVLRMTTAINEVFKENGFIGTGKHYPGGDDLPFDTHMTESLSYLTEEELLNFTLVPYLKLMEKGLLRAVMTSHTTYVNIDPEYPATLSKKILNILRDRGFDGVFFTDSLAMMGILQKYGEENVMGICMDAGIDIILPNYRTSTKRCLELLTQNFRDGMFTEERLNDAVRHILNLMKFSEENKAIVPVMTEQDIENLNIVARDCITAVTEKGVPASLQNRNKNRLFVVVTDAGFNPQGPEMEITSSNWFDARSITNKIKEEFPNSEIVYLPEFATASQNEQVLLAATKHDEVVFITHCNTAAYLGTDCLTRRAESLINCLILSGKVEAVLHYGNPHAVEPLMHVKRVLFGYSSPASLPYGIEVLSGKLEAKGTLPIKVALQ